MTVGGKVTMCYNRICCRNHYCTFIWGHWIMYLLWNCSFFLVFFSTYQKQILYSRPKSFSNPLLLNIIITHGYGIYVKWRKQSIFFGCCFDCEGRRWLEETGFEAIVEISLEFVFGFI